MARIFPTSYSSPEKRISMYVIISDNLSQSDKAKYPLREARVDVSEIEGRPGAYRAVALLRPHYQLDELTTSLRLVFELPASYRA
jgi:type VI secretion system protein ImpC